MAGKYLTTEEKACILAWKCENVTNQEISRRTGRSLATIKRLGSARSGLLPIEVPPNKPKSGRPRKTLKATDTLLRREVMKQPDITSAELKKLNPQVLGNVSQRTIRRRLQVDLNLPSRKAARKPLLTPLMKTKRLAFANKYQHWTPEQWSSVMFSDESTFKCIQMRHRSVRRPKGSSPFNSRYTVKTVKHPDGVMVWGCFSGNKGSGGLYFLPKNVTMNADRYIEVLRDHLEVQFQIHQCQIFMHDSAPCHKARKVTKWLQDSNIPVLDWPGNSPDLNPIENCWNLMKQNLDSCNTSSVPILKEELKKLWLLRLNHQMFKNLAESMPRRLQMVINNKGEMTKY